MIPDKYECEGQINLTDYLENQKPITYGCRGCRVCTWFVDDKCRWNERRFKGEVENVYPTCGKFLPEPNLIPRMCANCEHGNMFEFQGEQRSPVEEPNIYCTHREGSLNRRTEYKDREQPNFGVGSWDRQHEFDTCDRWELGIGFGGYPLCEVKE